MPSPRWLPLLAVAVLLSSCDRSLQQRTEEIRVLSRKEDRAYTTEALDHIRRNYWSVRDSAWYGKAPDGSIVCLKSPHATAGPLPASAFHRGWHLQLTISSQDWRSYPAGPHEEPFEAVYAITRLSATNWDIEVSKGLETSPLHREDVVRLQGSE